MTSGTAMNRALNSESSASAGFPLLAKSASTAKTRALPLPQNPSHHGPDFAISESRILPARNSAEYIPPQLGTRLVSKPCVGAAL